MAHQVLKGFSPESPNTSLKQQGGQYRDSIEQNNHLMVHPKTLQTVQNQIYKKYTEMTPLL